MVDGAKSRVSRSIVLSPDLAELSRARRFVSGIAAEAGFGETRSFDITLLTSEAAANAIEHAPVKGRVEVKALLYADRLEVQVKGPGEFQTPDRLKAQNTRGLGLPLMAKLSDHLALYSAPEGGTLLSLTFYREGHRRPRADSPLPPSLLEMFETSDRLEAVFEAMPEGFAIFDDDLRCVYLNDSMAVQAREPRAKLLGHRLTPAEFGVGPLGEMFAKAKAEGVEVTREVRHPQGSRWSEVSVIPFAGGFAMFSRDINGRKQAEKALKDSERALRLAEMAARAGFWDWDVQTGSLTWDQGLFDLFGIDPLSERASFEAWRRAVHPEDERAASARIDVALRDREPLANEYRVILPDGSVRWVYAAGEGMYNDAGEPVRMLGFCLDISQRKHAEAERAEAERRLAEGQELLATLLDSTVAAIALFRGSDLTYQYVNAAYQSLLPGRRMLGKRIGEVLPEAAEELEEIFSRVLETGETYQMSDAVFMLSPAPGRAPEPRSFSWTLERVRLPGQDGWCLLNTAVETTEQQQAQEALRESEQRTRHLDEYFERSPTPLALLDRDFNFIRVNGAYAKAFRRDAGDFHGQNHFELYPSDAQTMFHEVRRSKEPITIEARPFEFPGQPDRGLTYWDWSLTPLLDASGETEALLFSLHDVTARTRMGATRGRWTGWLEEQVLHRRGALAVTLVASLAEVALFFGVDRFESPAHYLGIPGAAAALIAVVAAVTGGPLSGVIVALVGGAAYFGFLTDFGRSVFWPPIVISIVLWTLAAWLAGVAGDYIRRRAAAREAVLSQSIKDREKLMQVLEASEERFRALAEENERLYEQQLDIAERLQRTLLNIPSEIGPFKLGHLYRSATEAARVGGDFYDVFEVKEGSVAVLIGDVAGHGIEAARTATLVKDVVHAFTHQTLRPADVLAHTNRLLIEKDLPGFVTVFLGVLDKGTACLRYSSAGHPDVLLRRASGEVERLPSRSAPLGVFADAEWKVSETDLGVDDRLVLYTDGVIEARRNGDFFGDQRLENLIREAQVPVEQLPGRVLDEVLAFSGGALKDDLAVLVLSLSEGIPGCTVGASGYLLSQVRTEEGDRWQSSQTV
jgi:PAS domain S-box-containing protein